MGSRLISGVFLLAVLVSAVSPAWADPTGATVAQIDLNRDQGLLEIAVRVDPKQLEEALTSYFGQSVDLTRSPSGNAAELERLERSMARYVRDTFLITAVDETPLELRWVGWERESFRRIWIYVEASLHAEPSSGDEVSGDEVSGSGETRSDSEDSPASKVWGGTSLDGLQISQRMFFELKIKQANTVRVRDQDRQTAITCTRDQPELVISFGARVPDQPAGI